MTVQMIADSHPPIVKTLVWHDEAATEAFAQSLASQPAIGHALIELKGDLGAEARLRRWRLVSYAISHGLVERDPADTRSGIADQV